MSIHITQDHQSLRVTGDIQTVLKVPPAPSRYWVTLSDGTLLEGLNDGQEHRFRVATEGAGFTRIDGSHVEHDWRVEWAAVSPYDAAVQASRGVEPLPLLEAMLDAGAVLDDEVPW